MVSRRIEDLTAEMQALAREHVVRCANGGISLLIYCTLRDEVEQARLFGQGRTKEQIAAKAAAMKAAGCPPLLPALLKASLADPAKNKVTNAGPGESFHQYGLAYDCVPLVNGKAVWSSGGAGAELWKKVGAFGTKCGLEWAGSWTKFREFPHFQKPGLAMRDLMVARYGNAAARAAVPAAAAAAIVPSGDADRLEAVLKEPDTSILVYTAASGTKPADVEKAYKLAEAATAAFPTTWRTVLIRDPATLTAGQSSHLWGGGAVTDGVHLSRAPGHPVLARYSLVQIDEALEIMNVLAQG